MSRNQTARRGMRERSIIPMRIALSLVLMAAICAAASAQTQSPAASDSAAPASARKDATAKRTATPASASGPFTYDTVGATPEVRKPAKPGASQTKAKAIKSPSTGKATTTEPTATNEPTRAGSR